ncbi:MAG: hypothetical protein WDZ48_04445 [Pirellulales bacterium]
MKTSKLIIARLLLLTAAAVVIPSQCFALAISTGSDSTAALGNTANAIVRIAAGGFVGTGTVVEIMDYQGGKSICILTADHVVRDAGGGGASLFAPNQITTSFGNQGGGGASFTATAVATVFDLPADGSNATDLAMISIFVSAGQLNTLPAGLAAVALPNASPAANGAITQAGYGLQGSVTTVSGSLAYVYSPVNALGAAYGTLKAGPNTVGAGGVANLVGAVSDYAGQNYQYDGFTNGALINGASPNYNGSTSYIFSGDSGGPSLSGNTILGVHSSSVTGVIAGDANSEFAYGNNAAYTWKDVDVFSSIAWINSTLDVLCVPEPASIVLIACGGLLLLILRYRRAY